MVRAGGIEPPPRASEARMQPLHHTLIKMVREERIELSFTGFQNWGEATSRHPYKALKIGGQPGNRTPNTALQVQCVPVSTSRPFGVACQNRTDVSGFTDRRFAIKLTPPSNLEPPVGVHPT